MGKNYVTMYKKLSCSQGCMENYLNVGTDHGVYKMSGDGACYPVMNSFDNKADTNITQFGGCNSMINPEFLAKTPQQQAAAKAKNAIAKQGLCSCNPMILTEWFNANEANKLEGKACLTDASKLACAYGGIITVVEEKKEG